LQLSRSTLTEHVELLRRRMGKWSLPLLLLGAFVLLYLCLFRLPFTPIFTGGDENLFLLDATRMMDGQLIYRDFFELITPGITLVDFAFFKLFDPRVWVSNVSLILVGFGLAWLIVFISRKVLSGGTAFLPAALFLTCGFVFMLDDTHQWYSALAVLSAIAVVLEKRTLARLLAAGVFCGLASFFTQTLGVFAVVGLAIFLLWEGRKTGQGRKEILRRDGYLFASYVASAVAANAYFVWKAGLNRFLYCTVTFVLDYYPADRASNSLYAPVFELRNLIRWDQLPHLGIFLFVHGLLPLVYIWFLLRYRREALAPEQGNRLMLLNIVGLLLFAGVAPAPTTYRLCAVAPLGFILLVWLTREREKLARVLTFALWASALCLAVVFPLRVQTQKMRSLDLPRGRLALDPTNYEKLLWLSRHTVPGDFLFTAAGTEVLFPLALRDPVEVPFVKADSYTRPEQVLRAVAALEKRCVRFVLSDPTLDFQGNFRSKSDHRGSSRGHLRSFFHAVEKFLGGGDESKGDNLGPLRNYLRDHYHLAKVFSDNTEVWERDQQPQ
jgi:hypothetical protein